jgi:hypothetical protein
MKTFIQILKVWAVILLVSCPIALSIGLTIQHESRLAALEAKLGN